MADLQQEKPKEDPLVQEEQDTFNPEAVEPSLELAPSFKEPTPLPDMSAVTLQSVDKPTATATFITGEAGSVEGMAANDEALQRKANTDIASSALLDESFAPADRVGMATAAINAPIVPRTTGEIYTQNELNVGPEPFGMVSMDVDVSLGTSESRNIQAITLTGDPEASYDEVINKEWAEFQGISAAMGRPVPADEEPTSIATLLDYLDPVAAPDSMDIEWGKVWDEMVDGDGDFVSQQFKDAMQSKYGDEWMLKMMAFGVRELGVDVSMLLLAGMFPPLAGAMTLGKAGMMARLGAAATRASVVGVGGGSVQSAFNVARGGDANFTQEAGIRFLGELGGEGFITLAKMGFKATGKGLSKVFKEQGEAAAKNSGKPMAKPDVRTRILDDSGNYKDPILGTILRASFFTPTHAASRVIGDQVTKGMLDLGDEATRKELAEIAGYSISELENIMPMAGIIHRPSTKVVQSDVATAALGEAAKRAKRKKIVEAKIKRNKVGSAAHEKNLKELATIEKRMVRLAEKIDLGTINTTGNKQADQILQGDSLGLMVMGNAKDGSRSMDNLEDFIISLTDEGPIFRTPLVGSAVKKKGWIEKMFSPVTALKRGANLSESGARHNPLAHVGEDLFDAVGQQSAHNQTFGRMFNRAMKGLSRKEKRALNEILDEGAEKEVLFSREDMYALNGKYVNDKVVSAYFEVRNLLDMAHYVNEKAVREEMIERGIKQHNDRFVEVSYDPSATGVDATKALKKYGMPPKDSKNMVYVKEVASKSKDNEPFSGWVTKGSLKDAKDINGVIDSHVGYIPINYHKASHAITVIKSDGTASRVLSAHSARAGKKAMDKMQADLDAEYASKLEKWTLDGEKGPKPVQQEAILHSWDDVARTGQVSFKGASGVQLAEVMTEESLVAVRQALSVEGLSDEQIRVMFKYHDPMSLQRAHIAERGPARLPRTKNLIDAVKEKLTGEAYDPMKGNTAPAGIAIAEYLQSTARRAGIDSWRRHAINEFEKLYDLKTGPGILWHDPGTLQKIGNPIERAAAKRHQDWLKRSINQKTGMETKFDNMVDNTIIKWTNGTPVQQAMALALDSIPKAFRIGTTEGNATGRMIGAMPKLLFGNMAQLFVQGSQAMASVGASVVINPKNTALAFGDLLHVTSAFMQEAAGKTATGEGKAILDALRKTGYAADLGTTDIAGMLPISVNPTASVVATVGKLLAAPFKGGEAINRVTAYLTIRRNKMSELAKGELKGLDGKPFKGALDDNEFGRLVTAEAKDLAFNMGRAGQLAPLSGHGSVLFQFKQVGMKALNLFESANLTDRQKFGAAAGMFGFWGVGALPVIPDLVLLTDNIIHSFDGTPSRREVASEWFRQSGKAFAGTLSDLTPSEIEAWGLDATFYERLLTKGGINAMTDGEVDIANRIALGRFVSDSLGTAATPEDAIVSISVLADMYRATRAVSERGTFGMINPLVYMDLYAAASEGEETFTEVWSDYFDQTIPEAVLHATREYGTAISYMGSFSRAYAAMDPAAARGDNEPPLQGSKDYFVSSSGRATGVEVSNSGIAQLFFGITPGALVHDYEVDALKRKFIDTLKVYKKRQVEKYLDSTPKGKTAVMHETIQEIDKLKIMLIDMNIKSGIPDNHIASTYNMFIQSDYRNEYFDSSEITPTEN